MRLDRDEFYIGYEGILAPGLRRVVRRAVGVAAVLVLASAAVATWAQRPLPDARFEFGRPQTLQGWLSLTPAPALLVQGDDRWTRHWLVGRGKFGADRDLAGARDGWVRLEGTLIMRERWRMLELVPGSVVALTRTSPAPTAPPDAPRRLRTRGEIIDAKCHLGVMNPGQGAAHRDCAVRCLSGGVPAMFAYRDEDGRHLALILRRDGGGLTAKWRRRTGVIAELSGTVFGSAADEVLVVDTP